MKLPNQTVFNIAATGIISQGGASFVVDKDIGPRCLYRNSSGRKCVAGWMLPDDKYFSEMEGTSCSNIQWFNENIEDVNFLQKIQYMHDEIAEEASGDEEFFEKWIPKMTEIAKVFNLNTDVFTKPGK